MFRHSYATALLDRGADLADDAGASGINGTPGFVIGRTVVTGVDGVMIAGALPFAAFDAKLKEFLEKK